MSKIKRVTDRFARSVFAKDILQHLRIGILSGELADSHRLVEGQLAQEYGVSRGPVRSALHALEQQGLVQIMPGGGAQVVGFSEKHALNLFDVRLNLEKIAARAMMKLPVLDTSSLQAVVEGMAKDGIQMAELEHLDTEFHYEFIKLADNWALLQLWVTLRPVISDMLTLTNRFITDRRLFVENHAALLDAIKKRDLDTLLDRIDQQIETPRKLISERYQQINLGKTHSQ